MKGHHVECDSLTDTLNGFNKEPYVPEEVSSKKMIENSNGVEKIVTNENNWEAEMKKLKDFKRKNIDSLKESADEINDAHDKLKDAVKG